ncbi:hypothetical protein Y919_01545 [Caloranaerobacter azorensis H53214]|uniref:Uncharacterized protein n=1 Tax=Caloranaerobacter azorensis H53214 TaxID=1156417 RepID=A0A096BKE1_9FIRM|nr:hypothetical protein [Caloranaerobacter azorensis]KGG81218.1 hypothetical protein Y919_01545 [Caloranaerobacter azorensis H53214]
MDDKTFELLEKMYVEILEIKQDVKSNAQAIAQNAQAIAQNAKAIARVESIIENQIERKIDALFDGYKQNSERITRLEEKVDRLIDRVERQEVEIKVIKTGC